MESTTSDLLHAFGRLTVIVLRGEPLFPASAIEAELGYRAGRLREYVCDEARWGQEFAPGRDYVYVAGEDLRAIKHAFAQTPTLGVCPFARNVNRVLAFTRRGVDLVAVKTDKPEGVELRARLVDEVFPALRERGVYIAGDSDERLPETSGGHGDASRDLTAERVESVRHEIDRLRAEADLVRARDGSDARRARAAAWIDIAREADALGRRDIAVKCRVKAAGEVIGANVARVAAELARAARQPTELLWGCTELARDLGVDPRWLGRVIIAPLGIQGDPRYSRERRVEISDGRQYPIHVYTAAGVERIRAALAAWRADHAAQGELPGFSDDPRPKGQP